MKDHTYFLYILASQRNGTLYVGITNNLLRRVQEHRDGLVPGFTKKYGVKMLVYFEVHGDIVEAIAQEKRMKRWLRRWKLELIEKQNPPWLDLWPGLAAATP
jgi:putative endonuclease